MHLGVRVSRASFIWTRFCEAVVFYEKVMQSNSDVNIQLSVNHDALTIDNQTKNTVFMSTAAAAAAAQTTLYPYTDKFL